MAMPMKAARARSRISSRFSWLNMITSNHLNNTEQRGNGENPCKE
jgi:hypothetical protein